MPPNITHLFFGHEFKQPVNALPQNITHLVFAGKLEHTIDMLPRSITYLVIDHYNYSISILPPNLIHFNCRENRYNEPLNNNLREILDILIEGVSHPKADKIFNPFPKIKNTSDLSKLTKLINEELQSKKLDISNVSGCSNDVELNRKIGSKSYAIINNALSDNYFSLSTIERFQTEFCCCLRWNKIIL